MAVSVIMPARNAAAFMREAIETVLAQGERMGELIVVDDGSTDDACGIVRQFTDNRIRLISGPGGRGVSAARNFGAQAAAREWPMFLDADDRLHPEAIANLLSAAATESRAVAICGDYSRIDARGRRIGVRRWVRRRTKPSGHILEQIVRGNLIVNGGVMIVRALAFAATGSFNERMRYCDWRCWSRLATLGEFRFIPSLLLDYRVHNDSAMSAKARRAQDFLPAVNYVFNDSFILQKLPGHLLPKLRQAAELHLILYAATQAIRFHDYRQAFAYVTQIGGRSSLTVPRMMLRVGLAFFGLRMDTSLRVRPADRALICEILWSSKMPHTVALLTSSHRADIERVELLCNSLDRHVIGYAA